MRGVNLHSVLFPFNLLLKQFTDTPHSLVACHLVALPKQPLIGKGPKTRVLGDPANLLHRGCVGGIACLAFLLLLHISSLASPLKIAPPPKGEPWNGFVCFADVIAGPLLSYTLSLSGGCLPLFTQRAAAVCCRIVAFKFSTRRQEGVGSHRFEGKSTANYPVQRLSAPTPFMTKAAPVGAALFSL